MFGKCPNVSIEFDIVVFLTCFFVFSSALRCDDFVVRGLYGCFVCGSELTLCWLLKQGRLIRSCSGADCRIQYSATGCQAMLFGFSQSVEVEGFFKSGHHQCLPQSVSSTGYFNNIILDLVRSTLLAQRPRTTFSSPSLTTVSRFQACQIHVEIDLAGS